MTIERTMFVRIPADFDDEFATLQAKANIALRRAAKLPPGDTSEIARFEALSAQIERRALANAACDSNLAVIAETSLKLPTCLLSHHNQTGQDLQIPEAVRRWLAEGSQVVMVALPQTAGATVIDFSERPPNRPAKPWKSSTFNRRDAESERFEYQVQRTLTSGDPTSAINPSGVSNRVLTATLRRYVDAPPGTTRVDVPVVYRDGSTGPPFPLHSVTLSDAPPSSNLVLRFTLLSIRHPSMDEEVDGAWFRNARISLHRPAGLTDADAFAISVKQLAQIRAMGPTTIEMYQTGLQPAVMGFYRAITHALIDHPGSIFVVPKFFVGSGFENGVPWRTR